MTEREKRLEALEALDKLKHYADAYATVSGDQPGVASDVGHYARTIRHHLTAPPTVPEALERALRDIAESDITSDPEMDVQEFQSIARRAIAQHSENSSERSEPVRVETLYAERQHCATGMLVHFTLTTEPPKHGSYLTLYREVAPAPDDERE